MDASPKLTPLRAAAPFILVSAAELLARWLDLSAVAVFTKPLLMPALALVVALSAPREPKTLRRLLFAAIALSWAGDVALMGEGLAHFAAGLGAFLFAHVLYIALFVRGLDGRVAPLSFGYAAVYAAMIYVLAPHVGPLLVPVLVYGAVLCTMAALATRGDATLALGGALFVASDAILASGRFVPDANIPRASFLVMLTYLAAQGLIVLSMTRELRRKSAPS
jgi:uncharacterized membrane protein YhhN